MEAKRRRTSRLGAVVLFAALAATAETTPIKLDVDATDAPRGLLHARLHIPATPGPLTLFYPKWIPGEHMPGGPINNVTGLKFSANGHPLNWQRDDADMFAFHLVVPTDADAVDVALDFLPAAGGGGYSGGVSATEKLLDLNWNQLLLYPTNGAPLQTPFLASLKLPAGWKFATALPVGISTRNPSGKIEFLPAPLETLVDSPVIAGEFFRTFDLSPGKPLRHEINVVSDSAAALEMKPEDLGHFSNLVVQANALFGAHHYRDYHFLLTLSDRMSQFGLEHHECSDDRQGENYLTDPAVLLTSPELLPHEMVHSWNGKYRRPTGLATSDYQQPMRDDLLWVYEGLTDYLGKILAARAGLQTNSSFRETFALTAAMLDHRSGRAWRSLADTAVAAPLLYMAPGAEVNRRRGIDFYPEGDLIWLEADVRIRQQTHGKKSLDDFCQKFYGGENSAPKVVPYSRADVENALNEIAPGDWHSFFQQRIYDITLRAPLGGIVNAGWRLSYTNDVPDLLKARESQHKFTDLNYSLGFSVGSDGNIGDVLPGSPADRAALVTGMKLIAVNERAWTAELLRAAVKTAATNSAPIELLVESGDYFKTYRLDYHDGEKYPVLERDSSKPDLLEAIIQPLSEMNSDR